MVCCCGSCSARCQEAADGGTHIPEGRDVLVLREGAVGEHGAREAIVRSVKSNQTMDQRERKLRVWVIGHWSVVQDREQRVCRDKTARNVSVGDLRGADVITYPTE